LSLSSSKSTIHTDTILAKRIPVHKCQVTSQEPNFTTSQLRKKSTSQAIEFGTIPLRTRQITNWSKERIPSLMKNRLQAGLKSVIMMRKASKKTRKKVNKRRVLIRMTRNKWV
jgi:hypothetical protein